MQRLTMYQSLLHVLMMMVGKQYSKNLKNKQTKNNDVVLFSVGGGSEEKNISVNIVNALNFAKKRKCKIIGVVGEMVDTQKK